MILIKIFLTALIIVSLCMANISGLVTDTGTTPIAGAVVLLEKSGQTTTTGADGSFTLVVEGTGIHPDNSKRLPNSQPAVITSNSMNVTIAKRSLVEVETFDLRGKLLSTVFKTLDAGNHSISLPQRGAGVIFVQGKSRE